MSLLKFSIIIPTRSRVSMLRDALRQLAKLDYPTRAFEVIVVDNGPEDSSTQTLVMRLQPQMTKLRLSYIQTLQMGASVARNAGLTKAKYPHVVFLDDDLVIPSQLLRGYDRAWKRYPNATVIGGKVTAVRSDRQPLSQRELAVLHGDDAWCLGATVCPDRDEELYPGGAVVSANLSYKKEKGVHELFNPLIGRPFSAALQFGSEDYELSQRLILERKKVFYVADADLCVANRVSADRFSDRYLTSRYWLHGIEMAAVENIILEKFPNSLPLYRGFLWWDLSHWPNMTTILRRFLTNKKEWVRLFSYLFNGRYIPS